MTKRAVIITSSVLVGILMIFTILFGVVFRVRDIKISFNQEFYYKTQIDEILTTSKVKKNTSIFDINRDSIQDNIEQNYPYARVDVNLSSLTSIKITLSNRTPLYYFVEEAVYYILDEDCKILNVTTNSDEANNYIKLDSVFDAGQSLRAGQFLDNKYTATCNNLYKALYSSAMIEVDNGEGVFESKYLERQDMCTIIKSIKFSQVDELNGRVDKLHLTTSYGVALTIIEPQQNLDYKINMVFSALRSLQAMDRQNGTTYIQSGAINLIYSYDDNNNAVLTCEYRQG
ncbi:MAG: FtsQ-type POTRA domain-containing protein [Clostridia bacterium]|nr:FtsQ-type POTRA domain-containing protein [Clostridia bacterium]